MLVLIHGQSHVVKTVHALNNSVSHFLGQWENGKNPQRGTYDRNWDRIGI